MNILKVALIGFGGIARSHNTAYQELATKGVPVSLVAVCDKNVEQFRSSITINLGTTATTLPQGIHTYADADELLANEDFDVADICLPSYLHKEYTIKML
ncbi:MAG: Gfo/Idh/MocA family oxidoreductase, partial [Clostridia bacterium]|nr:Gfo/Idh/MocA family oxidoreductase [Clostridia bacterium]